jgi:hypothetical protein
MAKSSSNRKVGSGSKPTSSRKSSASGVGVGLRKPTGPNGNGTRINKRSARMTAKGGKGGGGHQGGVDS